MLKKTDPHIEGRLNDLFSYGPEHELWRKEEVERVFAGGDNAEFRVPAADTGRELFFNNREMLSRFTSLCDPDQEAFLVAVRAAMAREKVDTIRLTVKWSTTKERVITIEKINSDGNLNIYI